MNHQPVLHQITLRYRAKRQVRENLELWDTASVAPLVPNEAKFILPLAFNQPVVKSWRRLRVGGITLQGSD